MVSDAPYPSEADSGLVEIGSDYEHRGAPYDTVLGWLHHNLKPRSYFEIGSFAGGSLQLATCATIAVDPGFQIKVDVVGQKPQLMLFQCGSDRFFSDYDPKAMFGRPIDLAFLDGMHLFEFLLRDFINTEKHCATNSVIAIHDCLPLDNAMTARAPSEGSISARFPDWWTGDVWKLVLVLQQLRPDLNILCVDAPPTGLVLCTHLSSGSPILQERYFELVDHWRDIDLSSYGVERFLKDARVTSTKVLSTFEGMASRYWL